ncbi:MAG: tRNA guanosine(15) transglycosylase TgtA [Candidatus Thermoplasmatota archaeon]
MFEIKRSDGLARIGKFVTPSGSVETPAIMPVINPNLELIPVEKLKSEFGSQILITNSYIIYQKEELKKKALEKGIHELLGFSGPIMTDSGTFQAHVYGDVEVEPEEILAFQKDIGSDISTILDEFTEPDESRQEADEKLERTVERAKRAQENFGGMESHTAYPIQGSIYPDLRRKCGKLLGELDGEFYPIGGVVPLMEDYRFSELIEIILSSKKGLGPRGPVHLFGAGHPMLYSLAALLGCDLFDSSSYAKYAKRGDLMYPEGTKNLDEIRYLGCECPVCTSHDAETLRDKYEDGDITPIAEHNLWICYREIGKIKQAIRDGRLWEFVETRARSHPKLLEALEVLDQEYEYFENFEPRSRDKAALYIGRESDFRPIFKRIKRWIMKEYTLPKDGPTVYFELDQERKPYSRALKEEVQSLEDYDVNLLVKTPLGPVPLELDEVYPIAQSIFPSNAPQTSSLERYREEKQIDELIRWEGEETLDILSSQDSLTFDEMKIRAIADYQFCEGAGDILTDGELEYVKNNRGRIKNVKLNDDHILSIRHYDGLFTLKKEGASLLWDEFSPPTIRIEVTDESAKFNREGKSVFSKFVTAMSNDLRRGDEALVVTQQDELVAVARVFLTSDEVEVFDRGLAASVRDGFEAQ